MPHWKTVAIVGVGLIGGSIGLGLRTRHLASTVVGIGRRTESLDTAKRVGAISEATTDLAAGVRSADLIVVCTPVHLITEHVLEAARHAPAGALITDAGSTKASIVKRIDAALDATARFIGSHPLAGSEKQGPAQSNSDLFVNRTVVITPTSRNQPNDRRDIEAFWTELGARVVCLSPEDHDRALAETSHLPHLVAAALADTVATSNHRLSAGGFRDTTRIAAGDPELWAQILLDNREHVLAALTSFERSVAGLRQSLEASNLTELTRILSQAKNKRDALGS